jgi:transcriptional regulator with PAS, ATPase and Fis domain
VTASNHDPKEAVSEGELRQDLLYRLNVFPVHLPPLRVRADDVIGPGMLPGPAPSLAVASPTASALQVRAGSSIAEAERRLILATPEELDGDKKRTAKTLGISVKTLCDWLDVYEAADAGP